MVATELNGRYTAIYFPSEEDKERWEGLAKEARVPLSRFLYEMSERTLNSENEIPRSERTQSVE